MLVEEGASVPQEAMQIGQEDDGKPLCVLLSSLLISALLEIDTDMATSCALEKGTLPERSTTTLRPSARLGPTKSERTSASRLLIVQMGD